MSKSKLNHLVLRLKKCDSAYFYFTLEANENLCFYSTLDDFKGKDYRDIEVFYTNGLREEFTSVLTSLEGQIPIQVLEKNTL